MGQSPSTLLSGPHHNDDSEPALLARDILGPLVCLADLRRDAFFGDVHYESSIEGDVLLPLDKVVAQGAEMWVSRHHPSEGEEGREVERALGGVLCPEVVGALGITLAVVLEGARREVGEAKGRSPSQRGWAERRGFAIAVGHLGGICASLSPQPASLFRSFIAGFLPPSSSQCRRANPPGARRTQTASTTSSTCSPYTRTRSPPSRTPLPPLPPPQTPPNQHRPPS